VTGKGPARLKELAISTEEGVHLNVRLVEGPSDGGKLYLRDDFSVAIKLEQSGSMTGELTGLISINFPGREIEAMDGKLRRRRSRLV